MPTARAVTCFAPVHTCRHTHSACTETHARASARPGLSRTASHPQDQHRDAPALQVEYFPPNGSYSLHYFPYYGKKAQVRGPRGPPAAAAREGTAGDACL